MLPVETESDSELGLNLDCEALRDEGPRGRGGQPPSRLAQRREGPPIRATHFLGNLLSSRRVLPNPRLRAPDHTSRALDLESSLRNTRLRRAAADPPRTV